TGTATTIGALLITELHGLSIHPTTKVLYGIRTTSSGSTLYRVSSLYGEVLFRTNINIPNLRAIAFRNDGTLFAGTTSGELFAINEMSGEELYIGNTASIFYSGFSFQPMTSKLWASVRPPISGRDKIYTVNTMTGQVTLVGNTGDNQITPSLAFDGAGKLYGLKGSGTNTNTLITIDTITASSSVIGSTGVSGLLAMATRADSFLVSVNDEQRKEIPQSYFLEQNYPNPFNPTTQFTFGIPSDNFVTLKVFNILGKEIATLVNKQMKAGKHSIEWNATNAPSGMYFYRLTSGTFSETKKMIFLK
ncbi:MAG: T9SS type A sorting domain-containing protein, partial [Ignavibacteriales bacterium]|nr:T9SS type A sorting domain-containing protein [Ignavibacteriales bacterium]